MAKQARVAYQSFAERFGERVRELCSQCMRCPPHGGQILGHKIIPTIMWMHTLFFIMEEPEEIKPHKNTENDHSDITPHKFAAITNVASGRCFNTCSKTYQYTSSVAMGNEFTQRTISHSTPKESDKPCIDRASG